MEITVNKNFSYKPLSEAELRKTWNKHKNIIEEFISKNQYDEKTIFVNHKLVMAVIAKVDQRKNILSIFMGWICPNARKLR